MNTQMIIYQTQMDDRNSVYKSVIHNRVAVEKTSCKSLKSSAQANKILNRSFDVR